MKLKEVLKIIQKNKEHKKLLTSIREDGNTAISVSSAARAYVLASLFEDLKRPALIITPGTERAKRLIQDLRAYSVPAELFPEVETMPYDSLSPSKSSVGRRLKVLDDMQSGQAFFWVAPIQSVMRVIPAASEALHRPLEIRIGDDVDLYTLAEELVTMGYARTPLVEEHGQFSLRGGIIDIFASHAQSPVRIELFGDEVESIRFFNVTTQRSTATLKEVKLYGCRQIALTEKTTAMARRHIPESLPDWLEEEFGKLKDMQYFEGVDKYLPFLYEPTATAIDYLPKDALIVIDEPEEGAHVAEQHLSQQLSYVEHLIEHKAIVAPPQPYFRKPKDILTIEPRVELSSIGKTQQSAILNASPVQPVTGGVAHLKEILSEYGGLGLKTIIALQDDDQLKRMAGLLADEDILYSLESGASKKVVDLVIGDPGSSFSSPDIGIALISASDIFGKKVSHSSQRTLKTVSRGRPIGDITDLKVGDLVVHSTHGIAMYAGLQRREVAGIIRDYALLEYAGSDRLFVPIEQLDRITKYIGAAGEQPTISRLGGSEWLKAKKKAKASVKKVAYDLLSLYAMRANAKGFAFAQDSPWQNELEDSFVYDETPDQLTAIADVKQDMESLKPMDRLICGDVGYGKTEVALRAAFKAVMDGKQVMVLVPTTILAQQHFNTFSERLAAFPVTVEMVSRFKSQVQQKDIIERFNKGNVDVLIGTHRLLSSDVKPFNLGFIIIDEEQRFGVNDKEKFRNFKKSVDVLTLSATPIPRTLQMSIAGVRDMSVIETPPEDRQPVITHVGRYDEEMMIQAIRRELGRGGQIYFVHNRVESIDQVATRIESLIPEARIAVAHGQMSEHQLEKIMLGFLDKKYDILVCTTIIESGIDIPSVNTLIVDRSELLGLAQLYQLRGRVGRANQRAYAYFFFSPQRLLTTQAFERLKTISDFTELGSGIKIAMRDLEIRGAGSLLGAEQHGHMSAVGFELYCQMLRESIEELEGKPVLDPTEIKIDLPVNAYLPESYIAEESLRIEVYKRIILARDTADTGQITLELKDRFGPVPGPVETLLDIATLRLKARGLGINEISHGNTSGRVRIAPVRLTRQQEVVLGESYNNLVFRSDRNYLVVTRLNPSEIMGFLLALFDDIMSALTTGAMISQKAR